MNIGMSPLEVYLVFRPEAAAFQNVDHDAGIAAKQTVPSKCKCKYTCDMCGSNPQQAARAHLNSEVDKKIFCVEWGSNPRVFTTADLESAPLATRASTPRDSSRAMAASVKRHISRREARQGPRTLS